jgi:hypothetical protein
VKVGDVMPDGSTVYKADRSVRGYNILSRYPDGSTKRRQYAPDTIIPDPGERHPSRFEGGHPWTRKGTLSRANT